MSITALHIPKIDQVNLIHVYRSTKPEEINTIDKVQAKLPIMVIHQDEMPEDELVNIQPSGKGYIVYDVKQPSDQGIIYNGPPLNSIPCHEYEMEIDIDQINKYSYANVPTFRPLPMKFNGRMYYYSIIGVDLPNDLITHLSKVRGLMVTSDWDPSKGYQQLYGRNSEHDEWKLLREVPWTNELKVGTVSNNKNLISPYVDGVPIFTEEEIKPMTRMVGSSSFMVIEFPNIWQKKNHQYNYRKLKQFRIRTIMGDQAGNYSEPTFQSVLPCMPERIIIQRKKDPDELEDITIGPVAHTGDDTIDHWEIVRRHGRYYDYETMKNLPLNPFNIRLGSNIAIFNEASTQSNIKIQMPALPGHRYCYSFYVQDMYGQISEPVNLEVIT